jgi:hypothetical protein
MNAFVSFPLEPYAGNDEQLGREITLLAGQTNAGNHRMLKLIAEFDDRKAWSGGGTVRSCPHWLNWKCGIALGAAREKVRVAHCLKYLPRIDAAFASGELSYSKVRAMTRVATPENEDYLLHIARHSTASHIEKVVGKYQKVQRTMHDKAEADQEAARKLVYYQDDDGMWIIHAKLPAEEGSLVVKALEAVARPIQREKQEEVRYAIANPGKRSIRRRGRFRGDFFSERGERGSQPFPRTAGAHAGRCTGHSGGTFSRHQRQEWRF